MLTKISKRDGRLERYQPEKITWAIFNAATACGGDDFNKAEGLCRQVDEIIKRSTRIGYPVWKKFRISSRRC